jgi:PAS domain S-box-containing protein
MDKKNGNNGHKPVGEGRTDSRKSLEAEGRFRAIFEQSPYGIVIIDPSGKIIEFNKASHTDLGYSREEFAQLHISDIDPFQGPEEIKNSMKEVLRRGEAEFEVKHRTKEGEIRDVHVITRVVNFCGRRVFQAIWHDITERKQTEEILCKYREHLEDLVKERTAELAAANERLQKDMARRRRAEEKLRESEERFRRIFEDGPLGIVTFGQDLKVLNTNKAICRMLGYSSQELAGRSLGDVTYSEDKVKAQELLRQLLEGDIPLFQLEKRCIRKNGDLLWTSMMTTALRPHDDESFYGLCMIEDISNRKLAEQEKERLFQELQVAMANIKTLRGLLPTCAWCRKVRDDDGYWKKVETYIEEHSDASFTHGICPECLEKYDPEAYKDYLERSKEWM